ncbi:MAG TPA: glycosyltransferase family 2 protein [Gallicola sp.]|nr:glycosyltransferase family 2 protein [Gallicola sp.]
MNPLVSVVIPFYNRVDWLCEAVESVLNQTYDNFEIIVVNDGSPENVDDFLSQYGDKIIYKYKENGGAATARNLALKYATGEYIAFLDSDDLWLPEKTQNQITFMEDCSAKWSHTGYYNWYPSEHKLIKMNNRRHFGDVYLQSFLSLKAPTPAIVIKKECFDKHPDFYFPEDLKYGQDSALWSKIAYHYPLALLNKPLVKIRQRGSNADLSSIIRFNVKSFILKKIKEGIYTDIPFYIKSIFKAYELGNRFLSFLHNKLGLKKNSIEIIGKILWITPYIVERIYVLILFIGKDKKYYR